VLKKFFIIHTTKLIYIYIYVIRICNFYMQSDVIYSINFIKNARSVCGLKRNVNLMS
jgi:hypothetical protein